MNEHIGVCRGGKNTKVHAIVDGLGNPIHVQLTGGQVNDINMAEKLLMQVTLREGTIVMADRAYGAKSFRLAIKAAGGTYCIPPKTNQGNPWNCDWWQYKERSNVECFFQKLKQFRRIATRYEKLAARFLAFVHIGCVSILLK